MVQFWNRQFLPYYGKFIYKQFNLKIMKTKYSLGGLASMMALLALTNGCKKDDDNVQPPDNAAIWSELGPGAAALNANNNINTLSVRPGGTIYASSNFTNSSGK